MLITKNSKLKTCHLRFFTDIKSKKLKMFKKFTKLISKFIKKCTDHIYFKHVSPANYHVNRNNL